MIATASELMRRLNDAIASAGASEIVGETTHVEAAQTSLLLAVHSGMPAAECEEFVNSVAQQFLLICAQRGSLTDALMAGAISQAFLAGALAAGGDSA